MKTLSVLYTIATFFIFAASALAFYKAGFRSAHGEPIAFDIIRGAVYVTLGAVCAVLWSDSDRRG